MASFNKSGRFARGYHPDQVDAFFTRARQAYEVGGADRAGAPLGAGDVRVVAFDLVWAGYDVEQVDSALDRLEDAVARRERDTVADRVGEQARLDQMTRRAQTLRGRLDRPAGERFSRGHGLDAAYHVADVDALCRRLLGYFDEGEAMAADDVRRSVFRTRRGRWGYRESEVDAFLDRAVEILVSVD